MHSASENIDNSNTNTADNTLTTETEQEEKQNFVSQIEAAFAKHLPKNGDIDLLIEKIASAYLDSPPHRNTMMIFSLI
jgi:hypothetical protein